ncbi:MAG TPA: ABC transporter substrate-binding protein [Stellaceae bacterium]|nr:ABC transporter substrate-binding protein [Stellaceae bacterium]
MTRRTWLTALLAMVVLAAGTGAGRADPIIITTTPAADGAPLFIAAAEGFYAKHGIDGKPTLTTLMPTLPAALVSNSVQIGCMTTTTFVQAVAGGLDLVAIAGGSVISHKLLNTALVARTGSNIHSAQDLVGGPKVGVPGLGAYFHVIVSYWLEQNGVDPKKVHFVETAFPAMRDMLASKTVDAVGAVDPILTLIVKAKVGYTVGNVIGDLPEGKSILVYAATRDWANGHRKEVAAFRAAIADADAFLTAHPEQALADLGKYIKLPPPVLAVAHIGVQDPNITEDQIAWWVGPMRKQGLLTGPVDTSKVVFK